MGSAPCSAKALGWRGVLGQVVAGDRPVGGRDDAAPAEVDEVRGGLADGLDAQRAVVLAPGVRPVQLGGQLPRNVAGMGADGLDDLPEPLAVVFVQLGDPGADAAEAPLV